MKKLGSYVGFRHHWVLALGFVLTTVQWWLAASRVFGRIQAGRKPLNKSFKLLLLR